MYHITTEQIETFLNLAQKKNYREVSEMLFITQPTVTKHIQRLEKDFRKLVLLHVRQGQDRLGQDRRQDLLCRRHNRP